MSEPAFGFFVAGSSIEVMNGVYVRRNPPRVKKSSTAPPIALYYEHEEGLWHMALNELPASTEEEEEDEDDDMYYWRQKKKKPTHEWVFIDHFGVDRFSHEGDTDGSTCITLLLLPVQHLLIIPTPAAAAAATLLQKLRRITRTSCLGK